MESATAVAEQVMDTAVAVCSAAWPMSLEAREIRRLGEDGYALGEVCDMDVSLSFDGPAMTGCALDIIRAAGLRVVDQTSIARGFIVVRLPMRLTAYDLSLTALRLNRMVAPFGGFAAVIGPAGPAISGDNLGVERPLQSRPARGADGYRAVS